jgi:hypothetical protein
VADVTAMSRQERVAEAMRRSLPLLPVSARDTVLAMLSPTSLAIVAGTLIAWAGSHFFGVGEIVDIILLGVGFIALGFSVFCGAQELFDFAKGAVSAVNDRELDAAAEHFAKAVSILGISTIQAVLLHGGAKAVVKRGAPRIYVLDDAGPPPPAGNPLRVSRPSSLPGNNLGGSDAYGTITISRAQSLTEQRITLYHELVHRFFSPRTGPLRRLRANVSMSAYERSYFLRYLEEALAEGYGQLKVNGFTAAFRAYRFPLDGGYVTVSSLQAEGMAVGKIVLAGSTFYVTVSQGSIPQSVQR